MRISLIGNVPPSCEAEAGPGPELASRTFPASWEGE